MRMADLDFIWIEKCFPKCLIKAFFGFIFIKDVMILVVANRCPGSAESSYEYLFPKDGYDLTVDTHTLTMVQCSLHILDLLV